MITQGWPRFFFMFINSDIIIHNNIIVDLDLLHRHERPEMTNIAPFKKQ
jgi:hypothetical protein